MYFHLSVFLHVYFTPLNFCGMLPSGIYYIFSQYLIMKNFKPTEKL